MKPHPPLPWTAVGGGLLAVALFSLTMPLMRLAVRELDPTVIGVGRMLLAAGPAAIVLTVVGFPRLSWAQFGRLCVVTGCLVFGFAWLTAIALRTVDSHHAAIVAGGIPLFTAISATITGGRRPSIPFWLAAAAGSLLVAGYGIVRSGGVVTYADLLLLAAAAVCGVGYSEGSRLASEIGSMRLTCLMPLVAVPGALLFCWGRFPASWASLHAVTWAAWLYNGLLSAFGAFFLWYPALRRGGVARIGQLQLVQPFLTLIASVLLLNETLGAVDWLVAAGVVACVAVAQRTRDRAPAVVPEAARAVNSGAV
ncbi:MAG TPA: DMT family transporter [Chthoniobacteraceae bacterium]|jgi:drug/metabolite transporter (DMT)-like permease|nr:DMT family transporter [Chthoniobacteraceae bacterium]